MSIVAFVTDAFAIRRILDHLGLSTPEAGKPPPLREVLRVAEQAEGWGVPAGPTLRPRRESGGSADAEGLPAPPAAFPVDMPDRIAYR